MMKLISNRNDVKMIEWNFKTNQNCMYNYYNSELNLINIFAQVCVFVAPFQCFKMCQVQNMHKRMNLNIHSRTVRQSNHEPWLLHFNIHPQKPSNRVKWSKNYPHVFIYTWSTIEYDVFCVHRLWLQHKFPFLPHEKKTAAAEAVNHIKAQI